MLDAVSKQTVVVNSVVVWADAELHIRSCNRSWLERLADAYGSVRVVIDAASASVTLDIVMHITLSRKWVC